MYSKKLQRFLEKPLANSPKRSPSKPFAKKNYSKNLEEKKDTLFLKNYSSTTKYLGMGKSYIENYIQDKKIDKQKYKHGLNQSQEGKFQRLDYKRAPELDRKNPMMHRSTIADLRKYDHLLKKISKPKIHENDKSPAPRENETQISKIKVSKLSNFEKEYKEIKESMSTLENTRRLQKHKNFYPFYDLFKKVEIQDFQFVKKIGNVKDKRSQFMAALQIIRKSLLNSVKMVNQFVREIKIHSNMKHPNIVNLYSAFNDDGNVYLLQQYCNGGQLYKRLKKLGKFSQKAVSFIIRNILDAVSYLHSNDIIHRDIKPQNIIIVHGNVKICDFGWAVHEPNKLRQTLCGTPIYSCPQLVKGHKYSDKIDLWTIGMLTYQLFFGQIPFRIQEEQDLSKIATDQIRFPTNSKSSKEYEDFVLQLLKKDPRERLTADILLSHPFIIKYKKVEVCEQLCF